MAGYVAQDGDNPCFIVTLCQMIREMGIWHTGVFEGELAFQFHPQRLDLCARLRVQHRHNALHKSASYPNYCPIPATPVTSHQPTSAILTPLSPRTAVSTRCVGEGLGVKLLLANS